MARPSTVDGMFLLGSNDARHGEIRIRAHDTTRACVGASSIAVTFGGRVSEDTEDHDVRIAKRRAGIKEDTDG